MASRVKTILFLDERYFREQHANTLESWLNEKMTYDRYKVELVEFPKTDFSMFKAVEVGENNV